MYSPPTPTPQDQANKSTRMNQGSGANAKKGNFPILKSVPIRGEEGYCQWDRRWITFSVTAYQESSLFSNAMFRCQNIISLAPTRSSFFIAGRGGGAEDFFGRGGGITWFLGEQKRGSVVIENPKREITENVGRIKAEEKPLESHQMLLGRSQSVK